MNSSNAYDSPESADLTGLCILVVEDSWQIGMAMKNLLTALGADVTGPAATTSEAEELISQQTPDVAIIDFNLRGGELAHGLIDQLNDRGIRVIVVSGYAVLPLAPGKTAAILEKPVVEAQLLAALRPVIVWKAAQRENPP
jgi:DNA-binding NtrC family response regulator